MKVIVNEKIQEFLRLFNEGIQAWEQAGLRLVEMVEEDENIFTKIIAAGDGIKLEHLETIERIGRKQVAVVSLLDESWGSQRVMDMGLSYEKQIELHEKPIPVAVKKHDGEIVVEQKRLFELSRDEARRAINQCGIVPPKEQKEAIKQKERHDKSRYVIIGDRVKFFATCTFSAAEIEEILARIKADPLTSAKSIKESVTKNQIK
jgi:hypothetical protein